MTWPTTKEDYLALARTLAELVGGRADVAARYFEFAGEDGKLVKGWAPWKGKRVAKDYTPEPGELVHAIVNRRAASGARLEWYVMRPLSPDNILLHLRGRERLGVYVLNAEARCTFLAADFDDHQGALDPAAVWAEVKRFVDTCETHDWRVHVERSKSGRGFHVWLFFDAPVAAAEARAIGKWLFEESALLREGEDFGTFDRFFPAQSTLPPAGKGFGNLIGLPLFGPREIAQGRTAWVDTGTGQLTDDQAGYTAMILREGRNPAGRVADFLAEWKLAPEEGAGYQGGPRDPDAKLGTAEEYEAVLSRCKFAAWASDPSHQAAVSEPLWYGLVSQMARFDIDEAIHAASCHHPGYSPTETDLKVQNARASSGPHRCKTIQGNGYTGCPPGGCPLPSGEPAGSPAGLAAWAREARPRGPKQGRTASIPEPGAPGRRAVSQEIDDWGDVEIDPGTGAPWPYVEGWRTDTGGVCDPQGARIVLRPLWVHALTRNNLGQWGVSIKFYDLDWKLRTYAFPMDRLHEQGGVLGRELAAQGLPIVPGKEKWVSRFVVVAEQEVVRRIRAASRLGWFDAPESPAVFVLPDKVIGNAREEIVYQPDNLTHTSDTMHGQGTLGEWQAHVADEVLGNPILMFALMVALGGPLLKLCQEQSGGFHLYGVTTGGKTTSAQVAASVWGCGADPQEGPEVTSIRKWYTTGNALESIAEVHNDTLLTLDEISEADPHELGRIIYQLAGGLSKGRATAGGGIRAMKTWRLLFWSTGEKSVRQMLAAVGQDQKGGQRVRLPDIPADDSESGDRAIVTDAHGRAAKDYVQDLKLSCARFYGIAGPHFVAYLIARAESRGMATLGGELRDDLRKAEALLAKDCADELPPEGRRVLRRFALVATAGIWAAHARILSWAPADILGAVMHVRDRWLSEQGQERSEMDRGLAHLRDALVRNVDRFRSVEAKPDKGPAVRDLLGFRSPEYYLLTESSLRELCGEYDMRTLLRALKTSGYLWHEEGRLTRKAPRLDALHGARPNMYWIRVTFIGTTAGGYTEEDRAAGISRVDTWGGTHRDEPAPLQAGLGDGDEVPF